MKDNRPLVVGIILITLGFLFIFEGLFDFDVVDIIFDLWPLILVFVGWQIIKGKRKVHSDDCCDTPAENAETAGTFDSTGAYTVDNLKHSSFIGDTSLRISSKNFLGGSVSSFIGDTHLNLSEIEMSGSEKTLNVSSVIGDVYITLPKDFTYRIRGSSIIGDIYILGQKTGGLFRHLAFRSQNHSSSEKQLHINVSSVIGEINIS